MGLPELAAKTLAWLLGGFLVIGIEIACLNACQRLLGDGWTIVVCVVLVTVLMGLLVWNGRL